MLYMNHPEEITDLSLQELLKKQGAQLDIFEIDKLNPPSIEIDFGVRQNESLICNNCGAEIEPKYKILEYSLRRFGVEVRFKNALSYFCGQCSDFNTSRETSQQDTIAAMLIFIRQELFTNNVSVKYPDLETVKSALLI